MFAVIAHSFLVLLFGSFVAGPILYIARQDLLTLPMGIEKNMLLPVIVAVVWTISGYVIFEILYRFACKIRDRTF